MHAHDTKQSQTDTPQQNFSADVSRLLDIVAHALYTNQDVFLRELISNAADACDRLRYDSIQRPELVRDNPKFRICVYKDTTNRTVTITDNGIGMSREELAENLGTIAKSGTASLMEAMKNTEAHQGADKLKLIGQFGVGFYAGYMVAHKIDVISRKAGSDDIWCWHSDGRSGFTITPATEIQAARLDGARGTAITLWVKDSASEFLIDHKITSTIKEYSDHISVPVFLGAPKMVDQDKEAAPVNNTSALWMRATSEITEKEYEEFYRHIANGFDEPLMQSHWKAEGTIEFTALLFIPTLRPWDLFDPSRRHFVKLYIRRVFISEDVENLMYPWLRFMRGVIDSEDLPLNISRESLQYNPTVEKIRSAIARRVLGDLDKLSRTTPESFSAIWGQFGAVLKEGLYDAKEHRESLLKVCRFFSTHDDGEALTSLEDYAGRMKQGQNKIYYLSGEKIDSIKNSPQLEGFKERGIEVLFMTDTIDDFWLQQVMDYKQTPFQSITKGDINLNAFPSHTEDGEEKQEAANAASGEDEVSRLILSMQELLADKVHNVRKSQRLKDSAVCLVAPDNGMDMHMERVLKIHQKYQGENRPVLELNPNHPLIKKLAALHEKGEFAKDAAYLLLDQAKIIQGEPVDDMGEFSRRMSDIMLKSL